MSLLKAMGALIELFTGFPGDLLGFGNRRDSGQTDGPKGWPDPRPPVTLVLRPEELPQQPNNAARIEGPDG